MEKVEQFYLKWEAEKIEKLGQRKFIELLMGSWELAFAEAYLQSRLNEIDEEKINSFKWTHGMLQDGFVAGVHWTKALMK